MRRVWLPAALMVAQALIFFRYALFVPGYAIPWDLRNLHLPHAYLYADSLAEGHLPLWDPFTYCGRPELANIQAATLYPSMPVVAVLGLIFGPGTLLGWLCWNVALHVALAGLGTWALLRALGASRAAAYFGATTYELCGFFAAHAEHMGAVMVAAWLPVALWCVVRWRPRAGWRPALLLAAAIALMVLAGLAPLAAVAVAACFGLGLLLAVFAAARWRLVAVIAGATLGGAALSAAQWWPTYQLTNLSVAQFRTDWLGTGGGVPWRALVSLLLPNRYHVFDAALYRQPYDVSFMYLYAGVLGLAFATLGLVLAVREPLCRVFSVLGAAGALAMLGDTTPVGRAVLGALPVKVRIGLHPELAGPVLMVSLAVLAGLALHRVAGNRKAAWVLGAVAAADLIAVSSGRRMNAVRLADEPGVSRAAFDGNRELLETLRRMTELTWPPERIDTYNDSEEWANSAPITRLYTANGQDVMAVYRTMQARLAFTKGERWGAYYQVGDPRSPVLGLMNVRYLLSREPIPEDRLAGSPFREEIVLAGHHVYGNSATLPRFFLVSKLRRAAGMAEAVAQLKSADFDPAHEAIVEGAEALPGEGATGAVVVREYGLDRLTLDVTADRPAYLVTSETAYPGWEAWLDGQPRPIYTTDVAFRGMPVPAGRHVVSMQFTAWGVWTAIAASGVCWMGWMVLVGLPSRCRKRNRRR
ncbi:MAG: YfhO family protein [Bryobacteraceae bacterium]